MFLERFCLPKTDTRLITLDDTLYKIKVFLVKPPPHVESDPTDFCSNEVNQENIEKIIVALLSSNEVPQPIRADSFVAYPYRQIWQIADKVLFYRKKKCLKISPYVHMFYIVQNSYSCKKNQQEEKPDDNLYASESSDSERGKSPSIMSALCDEIEVVPETDFEQMEESQEDECTALNEEKNFDKIMKYNQKRFKETFIEIPVPELVLTKKRKRHQDVVSKEKLTGKLYSDSSSDSERSQSPSIMSALQDESEVVPESHFKQNEECFSVNQKRNFEKIKEYNQGCFKEPLIKIPELTLKKRKIHQEILSEEKSNKKRYSVSEYIDKNRHEVEEQDLQEQLRLQELATVVRESNVSEKKEGRFQQMISSVKKMMFG